MTIFWCCKLSFYLLGVFFLNLSLEIKGQSWYDIRLVDGYRSSEGRVEIYYSGSWGTICDDGWGTAEANVVCRQLGYDYASSYHHNAHFGVGNGNIWLDDVICLGYENELIYCAHSGLRNHNCGHYEDVSVECYPPSPTADPTAPPANSLRLVDGSTTREGRLEIYHHGEWGTVCHDAFTPDDALVACRQLGFPGLDEAYYNAEFGEGSGRVWIANLLCNGNEAQLVDCDLYWEPSLYVCPHSEDVGVRCTDPDATLRLIGGDSSSEGRVEVLHNGQWGTICDDAWGLDEADVVCQQLGYSRASDAPRNAYFGEGTGEVWLDDVSCLGGESHIEDCQHDGWGVSNCGHHEDASVICYDGEEGDERGNGGLNAAKIAGIAVGSILGCCILLCIIAASCKGFQTTPNPSRSVNNIAPITYHNTNPTMTHTEPDEPRAPPPSYDQLNKYSSHADHHGAPPPPPQQAFDPMGCHATSGPYPVPSHQGMGYPVPPSGQSQRPLYHGIGGHHAGAPDTRSQYPATSAWQAPSIGSNPSYYPPPAGIPGGTSLHPSNDSSILNPAPPHLAQRAPGGPQAYVMYIPPQQGDNNYSSDL